MDLPEKGLLAPALPVVAESVAFDTFAIASVESSWAARIKPKPIGTHQLTKAGIKDAFRTKTSPTNTSKGATFPKEAVHFDDSTLRALDWAKGGAPELTEIAIPDPPNQPARADYWGADAFPLYARLAELAKESSEPDDSKGIRANIRRFFAQGIPGKLLTPETLTWVVRMANAADLDLDALWLPRPAPSYGWVTLSRLTDHPWYQQPLSTPGLEPGPLGAIDLDDASIKDAWERRDPRLFEVSDRSLRLAGVAFALDSTLGIFDSFERPLLQWPDPRLLLLLARISELNHIDPRIKCFPTVDKTISDFLKDPIPADLVTDQSIPWILRLVTSTWEGFGAPPHAWKSARLELPDGQIIQLTDHPAFGQALASHFPGDEPLGTNQFSQAHIEKLLEEANVSKTLTDLLDQAPEDPKWLAEVLNTMSRVREMGVWTFPPLLRRSPRPNLEDPNSPKMKRTKVFDQDHPKLMDALARLLDRLGEANEPPLGESLRFGEPHVPLAFYAPYLKALRRREGGWEQRLPSRRPKFGEPAIKEGADTFLHSNRELLAPDFHPEQLVLAELLNQHGPAAFELFARLAELAQPATRSGPPHSQIRAFLSRPVPGRYLSAQSVGWLTRIAKASELAIEEVMLEVAPGQLISLDEHPDFPSSERADPRRLSASLSVLGDRAATAGARSEALRELLATEPLLEFHELFPPIAEARWNSRFETVPVDDLAEQASKPVLHQLFERWESPQAIVLLSALLLQVPSEEVRDLLEAKGCTQELADRWSDLHRDLQRLPLPALENALRLPDPRAPDFTTIALRAALAVPEPDQLFLQSMAREAPIVLVQELVWRALHGPEGSPPRAWLAQWVNQMLATGVLQPSHLTEACDQASLRRFFSEETAALSAKLSEKLQSFLGTDQPGPEDFAPVLELIREQTPLATPLELAEVVLQASARHDHYRLRCLNQAEAKRSEPNP